MVDELTNESKTLSVEIAIKMIKKVMFTPNQKY